MTLLGKTFCLGLTVLGFAGLCSCGKAPAGNAPSGKGGGGPMEMEIQVVAVQARKQVLTETLPLVGDIAPNESVELKAETEGIVQEIVFDEGQRVEKDQLLLRLDESRWASAVQEAEANFHLSQSTYERAKQLFQDKLISQQEFDQSAATFEMTHASLDVKKRQLKDARVYAPFGGITGARQVSPGQVVSRNTTLTTIVDLDPVKVEMNVPERFLSQLKVGQSVEFEVRAYPGRKFQGDVYFIAPQLDLAMRTALVKTRIANPDFTLKAGMVANIELTLKTREDAVVVPEVALVSSGDNTFVFVVGEDKLAKLQPITVGQRLPRWAEVSSGLKGGEWVVVEGHQKVVPGMKLRLAPAEKAAPYLQTEVKAPLPTKG